jgi:hypothetical protein
MKYLNRFYSYIKESKDFDKADIEYMLLPIKDLGLSYSINEGVTVSVDGDKKNHNKKYLRINISLNTLNSSYLIVNSFRGKYIDDERFWEILDELLTLRSILLESEITNCLIDFSNNRDGINPYISILLIGDEDNKTKLIELETRITAMLNSMRGDFSYGTYCRLHVDHILVKSDGLAYTDRKFNNLLKRSIEGSDLSLSDFNIEKAHNKDTHDWFIRITTKE